jgi:hypothetical protein
MYDIEAGELRTREKCAERYTHEPKMRSASCCKIQYQIMNNTLNFSQSSNCIPITMIINFPPSLGLSDFSCHFLPFLPFFDQNKNFDSLGFEYGNGFLLGCCAQKTVIFLLSNLFFLPLRNL